MRERVLSYLYGGLTPAEETAFRAELESNTDLARCLEEEQQGLHRHVPVGGGDADLPEGVVEESRLLLRAALRRQTADVPRSSSPWSWLNLVQAGAAVALVLAGVLLGHNLPATVVAEVLTVDNLVDVRVRGYDARSGHVELELVGLATTQLEGRLTDPAIQATLSAAMLGDLEPGARLVAVDLLRHQTASTDIRHALTEALLNDDNPGVRIAAAEALMGLGADDRVRQALQMALVEDDNAGVRVAAIEGLRNINTNETRDVMERVSRYESNEYIRAEAQRALNVNDAVATQL